MGSNSVAGYTNIGGKWKNDVTGKISDTKPTGPSPEYMAGNRPHGSVSGSSPAKAPAPKVEEKPKAPGYVFPVASNWELWVGGGSFGAPRDGGRRRHTGFDIGCPKGTPLLAVINGTIGKAGDDGGLGGIRVWVNGDDGRGYYYAHCLSLTVKTGQRVAAGQIIGYAGNTGNAKTTPTHLHFGIQVNGEWTDPYPFLLWWSGGLDHDPSNEVGVGFDILAPIREFGQSVQNAIESVINAGKTWIIDQAEWVRARLEGVYNNAATWIGNAYTAAKDWVGDTLDWTRERLAGVYNNAATWISSAYDFAKDAVASTLDWTRERLANIYNNAATWISAAYNATKDWLGDTLEWIRTRLSNIYNNAATWIGDAYDATKNWIAGVYDGAKTWIANAYKASATWIGDLYKQVIDMPANMWKEVVNIAKIGLEYAKQGMHWFGSELAGVMRLIESGPAGDIVQLMYDKAVSAKDFMINSLKGGLGGDPYHQASIAGVAFAGASLGGLGIATLAALGELVHPLKRLGLSRISSVVYEAAGFGPVIVGMVHPIAKAAVGHPMEHVANAWFRPSIPKSREVIEAWHKGKISEQTVDNVLGFEGYGEGWTNLIKETAYRPMRLIEITRMTDNIPMAEEDIAEMLHYHSYNPKFIPKLVAALKKRSYQDEYKDIIALAKKLYASGVIENEKLKEYLRFCNYAEDMVEVVVGMLDAQRYHDESTYIAKAILTDFDNLAIDETDARSQLYKLGLLPNWIESQIRQHKYTRVRKAEAALRAKTSPEAVRAYQTALRVGVLSEGDFRSAVKKLGLSDEKIEGLVLLDKYTKQGDLIKQTQERDQAFANKLALKLADAFALAFRHDYIDEATFRTRLKESGNAADKIEAFINTEKVIKAYKLAEISEHAEDKDALQTQEILESSYRLAFRVDQINEAELRRLLREISIPDRKVDAIVKYELIEKTGKVSAAAAREATSQAEETKREMRKAFTIAYRKGRIGDSELRAQLVKIGYPDVEVNAIVDQERIMQDADIQEAKTTAAEVSQREVDRIIESALRNAYRHYLITEDDLRYQLEQIGLSQDKIDAIVLQESIAQEAAIKPAGNA